MQSKIVLAEDEPITRMDIFEILTCSGYDVVGKASDGLEVVELCRINKPDLVIMDGHRTVLHTLQDLITQYGKAD